MKKLALGITCLTMAMCLSGCNLIDKISGLIEGGEDVPITAQQARSNLLALGEEQGFLLNYTFEDRDGEDVDTGTVSFGMKGDTVWYLLDGADGVALVKNGNEYTKYEYDANNHFYLEADEAVSQADYDLAFDTGSEYLFFAQTLNGALKSDGDITVQGRECYKYNFLFSELLRELKVNMNMTLAVDKQIGITLKVEATGDVEDDSVMLNMEMSSFVVGDAVTLPTLVPANVA